MYLIDKIFIKFIIVGILNALVGSVMIFTFYNILHLGYWFSSASTYIFGSILSFFLNKYFTFGIRNWSVLIVVSFVLTVLLSYLLAYSIAKLAINYILRNNPQNIRENIALFTGICLFTGLNYIGQRLIVFRKK